MKFTWTCEAQSAHEILRMALPKAPVSTIPDNNKPFVLYTDASAYALNAMLAQEGKAGGICLQNFECNRKKVCDNLEGASGDGL